MLWDIGTFISFNSLKVRLKGRNTQRVFSRVLPFQFLKGAIKRTLSVPSPQSILKFQFLKGAIKRIIVIDQYQMVTEVSIP